MRIIDILDNYIEDFKYGSKWLSDFGGIVYNQDGWKVTNGVTISKITEKLNGRSGELFQSATYSPRVVNLSVFLQEEIDTDEFFAWLMPLEEQDLIINDRKIKAIFDNQLDIRSYMSDGYKGTLDISFICYDPFWISTNERPATITSPTINNVSPVKNEGNTNAYPIIKIMPNGNQAKIRFKLNDMVIVLTNLERETTIDCLNEEVYDIRFNNPYDLFSNYWSTEYYEFPYLKPYYNNTITLLEGNVSKIEILNRSRWI